MSRSVTLVTAEEVEGSAVLLPASYDILWSTVVFVVLLALFWKYALPRMQQALDERTAGIEAKLEQAELDRAEAQALLAQYREQLAEARTEAARIRAEAQSDRQSIVTEARQEAEVAAAAVTERAQVQLAAEAAQARSALSRDVGRLATDLAEKIIGGSLDEDRTQVTVERFLAELEATVASNPNGGEPR